MRWNAHARRPAREKNHPFGRKHSYGAQLDPFWQLNRLDLEAYMRTTVAGLR
ncbi:MAG TPA: hypothetical protein VER03_13725 [Bryobacteraceae bacterium]|nr:hypothetical protein [Bryobacteraceae bacterium]